MVITKDTLLDVLGDRVVLFLGGNLHLGLGHLRDFNNHVVGSLGLSLERDVVPWGDSRLGFRILESQSERFGSGFSSSSGGVSTEAGVEGSGRDRGEGRSVSSRKGKDGKDRGLELHLGFVFGMVGVVSCTKKEGAKGSAHGDS